MKCPCGRGYSSLNDEEKNVKKEFSAKEMYSLPALATGAIGLGLGAFLVPKLSKKGRKK